MKSDARAPLIVDGEDQTAPFCCMDFSNNKSVVRHRFTLPRGTVDLDGEFVPYWLARPSPRCPICPPECQEAGFIDDETPFTKAEFVAMLDALDENSYLWEEMGWHNNDRPAFAFIAYARRLLPAQNGAL
jgi:hypothetical protein